MNLRRLLTYLMLFSAGAGCVTEPGNEAGKLVLTFDDDSIREWYDARDLFDEYDIRATFFITRVHLLSTGQFDMLRALQQDGHEVGHHSLTHKNVVNWCDTSTLDRYIAAEVTPATEVFRQEGFDPVSFAYPNGSSRPYIDTAMLEYFQILRKATYNWEDTLISQIDRTYYQPGAQVVDAMGIDMVYRVSLDNLETAFQRIAESGEALVLHAHRINDSGRDYSVSKGYLEEVFELCRHYGISSITCKEIRGL